VDVRGGPQGHMKFVVARRSLLPTTPHPPNLRVLPPHRFCPRSTQHRLAAATSAGTVVTALRRSRCHRQLRIAPSPPGTLSNTNSAPRLAALSDTPLQRVSIPIRSDRFPFHHHVALHVITSASLGPTPPCPRPRTVDTASARPTAHACIALPTTLFSQSPRSGPVQSSSSFRASSAALGP